MSNTIDFVLVANENRNLDISNWFTSKVKLLRSPRMFKLKLSINYLCVLSLQTTHLRARTF